MSEPVVRLQHPLIYAGKWRKVLIPGPEEGDLYVRVKGAWMPIIRRSDDPAIARLPAGDPVPALEDPE